MGKKRAGKQQTERRRLLKYVALAAVGILALLWLLVWASQGANFAVLDTKGDVAHRQRDLIVFATILSLVVIVPVLTMALVIAWKYRESNTKATYRPNWSHSYLAEGIWWAIPIIIILILSVVIWRTSHSLDPYRPLQSNKPPVTIQVVALQWKWLFIYPDHDIATINYAPVPVDTPINLRITADSPMNSFWVPELGGQIYAMNGMETKLHLIADRTGSFAGISANISGEGFSQMRFTVDAMSNDDFEHWMHESHALGTVLDAASYATIAAPGTEVPVKTFGSVEPGLYNSIMHKFMGQSMSLPEKHEDHDAPASTEHEGHH